jgi:hypothetical protein
MTMLTQLKRMELVLHARYSYNLPYISHNIASLTASE